MQTVTGQVILPATSLREPMGDPRFAPEVNHVIRQLAERHPTADLTVTPDPRWPATVFVVSAHSVNRLLEATRVTVG